MRSSWPVGLVACGAQGTTAEVTIEPASASVAPSTPAAYGENAQSDYAAAETLAQAGRTAEARAAFALVVRKFPYSRVARNAERRITELAATLGDVTCRADSDCTATSRRECCDCCPTTSYATSRVWLAWRDGQCASKACACDERCTAPPPARVTCKQGACALASP